MGLKVHQQKISRNDKASLESLWLQIQSQADLHFFISWHWISVWLDAIDYQADLLTVYDDQQPVGVGLICFSTAVKRGVASKQCWLQRTGNPKQDQIWVEYNDLVCIKGREWAIRAALVQHFENDMPKCDELMIGVSNADIAEVPRSANLMQFTNWKTNSFATKLEPEFADFDRYLATLSANTRNQIRRTKKLYEQQGEVVLHKASSVSQALKWLELAGELHKQRWGKVFSGFENHFFVQFHQQLIQCCYDKNVVDVLCLSVNNQPVCYLYNFVFANRVYFYLSGIQYEDDNRIKPGLLAHSLATSYYAGQGIEIYDYMGGEGRYKKSLSNQSDKMIISSIRRKTLPFILSRYVHRIKARIST